jgi:hypothetical protein
VISKATRFRLAVIPLLLYAAIFAVLSLDVIARLIARSGHQEIGNLLLIVFFELMRAMRVLIDLALAIMLLVRSVDRRDARALILFLLFGLLAYAMTFSGGGYVGPFQEWLTRSLRAAGFSRGLLFVAFGYGSWAAWLALAGWLRFSVLFPIELEPEAIAQSGARDRKGMMRSLPGAGLDIGQLFRRVSAVALRCGWLTGARVWIVAVIGAALTIALRPSQLRWLLWLPFLVGVGISITCLRASYTTGDEDTRERIRWIGRGAFAAITLFAITGVVGIWESAASAVLVFLLMTVAPGLFLIGLGMAVYQRRRNVNVAPTGS